MDRVYIETTIVSYLTAKPSRDLIIAGRQQITRDWWDEHRMGFELCISQLVVREAEQGDPQYAQQRLELLQKMLLLDTQKDALELAKKLVSLGALPQKAFEDALHIAVAAHQQIPYLLTWNLRHMVNARLRPLIERTCEKFGYKAPIICTPEELRKVQP